MKRKVEKTDVGVIVGRFQVNELHPGHLDLIKSVVAEHDRVLIFLGLSAARVTRTNPLDFEARKHLIQQSFPSVEIHYIKDQPYDDIWSKDLDTMIHDMVGPGHTVTLYGGRDAFISHYKGDHPVQELVQDSFTSGTLERKKLSRKVKESPDFRAGVIWAAYNQWPHSFPTVDIAIVDKDKNRLLLARKDNEEQYRFVGGFAGSKESLEESARREVMEETHCEIGEMKYITSMPIDDWRYRGEEDGIVTTFFEAAYIYGPPKADDDIVELRWFDIGDLVHNVADQFALEDTVIDTHMPLVKALIQYYTDFHMGDEVESLDTKEVQSDEK